MTNIVSITTSGLLSRTSVYKRCFSFSYNWVCLRSLQVLPLPEEPLLHHRGHVCARLRPRRLRGWRLLWRSQIGHQGRLPRHHRHLWPRLGPLDLSVCFWSLHRFVTSVKLWCLNIIPGPTFGGILFDAITFRWAIFLVVILEVVALLLLVAYLVTINCQTTADTPIQDRTTSVEHLPAIGETNGAYGSTANVGARQRKYSESVGKSYVASSVARWEKYELENHEHFQVDEIWRVPLWLPERWAGRSGQGQGREGAPYRLTRQCRRALLDQCQRHLQESMRLSC